MANTATSAIIAVLARTRGALGKVSDSGSNRDEEAGTGMATENRRQIVCRCAAVIARGRHGLAPGLPGQIHHAAVDGEDLAIFAPQAPQECGTGQTFVARDEYALTLQIKQQPWRH
jgi:hypothetical protein